MIYEHKNPLSIQRAGLGKTMIILKRFDPEIEFRFAGDVYYFDYDPAHIHLTEIQLKHMLTYGNDATALYNAATNRIDIAFGDAFEFAQHGDPVHLFIYKPEIMMMLNNRTMFQMHHTPLVSRETSTLVKDNDDYWCDAPPLSQHAGILLVTYNDSGVGHVVEIVT